jgi:hypothetical protein
MKNNWNQNGVAVRSHAKAGSLTHNHNQGITIRSKVKAGGVHFNHNQGVAVRTKVKAGVAVIIGNHNQTR